MGIDYVAFTSKAREEDLRGLVIRQSRTFRAMPYHYWSRPHYRTDEVLDGLQNYLFLDECKAASAALRSQITVIPEESRRVAFITNSPVMPPQVQFSAYSSYLPSRLKAQLELWRKWFDELRAGDHENYLKELYLEFISWELVRVHDEALSLAKHCLTKPRVAGAAKAVCLYPSIPRQIPVAIKPLPQYEDKQAATFQEIENHQQKLLPLIKDLNYTARKHRVALGHSWWNFDKFRKTYVEDDEGSLQDFFNWVGNCCVKNYGLYLCW